MNVSDRLAALEAAKEFAAGTAAPVARGFRKARVSTAEVDAYLAARKAAAKK